VKVGATFVVMWSSGFVGATLGTRAAAADTLLAWRYLAAAVLLLGLVGLRSLRLSGPAWGRQVALGGLIQCGYLGGIVTGVGLGVPAGTAALVAALQPLVVATAAGPLLGERTTRRQRHGLALGLVGVTLVVAGDLTGGGAPAWAYLLPVGGMLALSGGTLLERHWNPREPLLDALAAQTTVAAVLFISAAALAGHLRPPADPSFWWAVAWVVVLSTFGGYGTYLAVLRRYGATRVSTLLYLTPPTTAIWALVMFGEQPRPLALGGFVICAGAVRLVLGRGGRSRDTVAP